MVHQDVFDYPDEECNNSPPPRYIRMFSSTLIKDAIAIPPPRRRVLSTLVYEFNHEFTTLVISMIMRFKVVYFTE